MRLPLPDRLNPKVTLAAIAVLFALQIFEGTNLLFAILTSAFLCIWMFTFNLTGGVTYPSGSMIFFQGFFSVWIGLGVKALLGQPADSHLLDPLGLMTVYSIGMFSVGIALFLSTRMRTKKAIAPAFKSLEHMKQAAIVLFFLSVVVSLALDLVTVTEGSFWSALRQLNIFGPVAILLATVYQVRKTNGQESFNWINGWAILFTFLNGLYNFGKEGMLIGITLWGISAALSRYDFKWRTLTALLIAFGVFNYYLIPYSQYVRNLKGITPAANAEVAIHYLSNLKETRALYEGSIEDVDLDSTAHLYDKPMGFLDRLIILSMDDQFVNLTNQGHVYGLMPTYTAYANIIPHFLWKNKPASVGGNEYAHELGNVLADDDTTTGISLSAAVEAYHQAKWLGLLVLLPIDWFLFAFICDSFYGSTRDAPWALLPVMQGIYFGPQGGLQPLVYGFTYQIFGMCLLLVISMYLTPLLMSVIKGRSKNFLQRPVADVVATT